jgi:chromosome segregation ATPase
MSVIEKVRERFAKREKSAALKLDELRAAVANDQEIAPEAVEKVLDAAGVSLEEFESQIEKYRNRQAWLDEIDKCQEARRKAADVASKVEAIDAEIAAFLKPRQEKMHQLQQEYQRLSTHADHEDSLTRQLFDSAPEAITDKIGELFEDFTTIEKRIAYIEDHGSGVGDLNREISKLEKEIEELKSKILTTTADRDFEWAGVYKRERADKEQLLAGLVAMRHDRKGALAQLRPQLAEIQQEIARYNAMKLEVWPTVD